MIPNEKNKEIKERNRKRGLLPGIIPMNSSLLLKEPITKEKERKERRGRRERRNEKRERKQEK